MLSASVLVSFSQHWHCLRGSVCVNVSHPFNPYVCSASDSSHTLSSCSVSTCECCKSFSLPSDSLAELQLEGKQDAQQRSTFYVLSVFWRADMREACSMWISESSSDFCSETYSSVCWHAVFTAQLSVLTDWLWYITGSGVSLSKVHFSESEFTDDSSF